MIRALHVLAAGVLAALAGAAPAAADTFVVKGMMVFWITNRYEDDARGWNLEEKLTRGAPDLNLGWRRSP